MKILYVDDEILYRKSLELVFRKDYDFHTASSENKGLEMIANNNFDIIITDGNLVGSHADNTDADYQGGVNVAKSAKNKGIYVAGVSSEPERFRRVAGDALDVIYKKPVDITVLKYIIDNKPTQEELKKFILTNKVNSKLGIVNNPKGLTLKQQKEWMDKYNEIEQSLGYMN